MRAALIAFFSVLLLLLILTARIKIKAAVHVNIPENVGFGAIKFVSLKLFCAKFSIAKNGKISMESALKKKKKKKKAILRRNYIKAMLGLISVRKFEVFIDSGTTANASSLCLFTGFTEALCSAINAFLLNKYRNVKIFSGFTTSFDRPRLEISGSIVISFSLLDMMISIIYAYFMYFKFKLKELKNG